MTFSVLLKTKLMKITNLKIYWSFFFVKSGVIRSLFCLGACWDRGFFTRPNIPLKNHVIISLPVIGVTFPAPLTCQIFFLFFLNLHNLRDISDMVVSITHFLQKKLINRFPSWVLLMIPVSYSDEECIRIILNSTK